jgi:hypothetical protein
MIPNPTSIKAVALISMGLDSLLAARLMQMQGIEVHGIHFLSRFLCLDPEKRRSDLEACLGPMGLEYSIVDYSEALKDVLINPAHGYGSEVNPCIDCRLLSLRLAQQKMESIGARFLITGEVVGQRPMTQNKPTIQHISKVSGLKGLIVRPLSAKLLPPTIPEREGWIDREQCLDIAGRSRKRQLELAESLQLPCIPQPAGGCVLTDRQFGSRFNRLTASLSKAPSVEELVLLRFGRHIWPNDHLWVIVGRDQTENEQLDNVKQGFWVFYPENGKGPLVLARGIKNDWDRETVCRIASRYSGGVSGRKVTICYETPDGSRGKMETVSVRDTDLENWRL